MRLARRLPTPRLWLDLAGGVCALALLFVHALQSFGGYSPCELCLHEREVFWIALALALAGRLLVSRSAAVGRWAVLGLGGVFAAGAILAAYHAGVEWRWWPGPAACTARVSLSALKHLDLIAALRRPIHAVACDQAALRVAGLSLAGWNAILCAGLAAASFTVSMAAPRRDRYRLTR